MTEQPGAGRPADAGGATPLVATRELLSLAQQGNERARDQLVARYLPRLIRWTNGRLPQYARSLLDTADVVQETLLRVLQRLDHIEVRGPGGFEVYVRRAVINRIRDEVAWAARRPGPPGVPETLEDRAPSPLEHAIGADLLEHYERALAGLSEEDQRLLHLRIELGFDYQEIAEMTERPSRDAVRVAAQRALARLADAMGHER
jgi:RNA polymerase sigma-70 factor (ECF subfamily)